MSTLIVEELKSGIVFEQKIRIYRPVYIKYIRPWVLIHGNLTSGVLTMNVKDGANTIATYSLDYTELNSAKSQTYAHGYIRFTVDGLQLNIQEGQLYKEYGLEFSMVGYVDSSNFVGLCKTWDNKIGITYGDVDLNNQALNDAIEPVGIEIYAYQAV